MFYIKNIPKVIYSLQYIQWQVVLRKKSLQFIKKNKVGCNFLYEVYL